MDKGCPSWTLQHFLVEKRTAMRHPAALLVLSFCFFPRVLADMPCVLTSKHSLATALRKRAIHCTYKLTKLHIYIHMYIYTYIYIHIYIYTKHQWVKTQNQTRKQKNPSKTSKHSQSQNIRNPLTCAKLSVRSCHEKPSPVFHCQFQMC